ncbi:MAG: transposase [Bacilli bacterium]
MADNDYRSMLVDSRTGLNMKQSEFDKIDEIISDGVKKGKSIYSIVLNNPEIKKSERTIYRYVGHSYFQIKNIDLRNKVKMKPRKSYASKSTKEQREIKKETIDPRNYEAYIKYQIENRTAYTPQFDLVQGKKGTGEPYLMTFIFPFSNLMIGYLIPNKEQGEIVKIFNKLEETLGKDTFMKIFPACLTDRGNEFLDADGIEKSLFGESKRTNLFYCDPYSSCQKPEIERNHEFFRFFSPKSLSGYTQEEIDLIFSHINSYNRKSKDDRTPYEIFAYIYGEDVLNKLNIKKIEFNDIDLTPNLIIKFKKTNKQKRQDAKGKYHNV